jgi:hypothetical protein
MRLAEPTPWSADRLELGEGARWVDGRLILVDLLAGRLLETGGDEPGPLRELRRLDAPLGAVAPVDRYGVGQGAYNAGRSRQGAPVRTRPRIQSMICWLVQSGRLRINVALESHVGPSCPRLAARWPDAASHHSYAGTAPSVTGGLRQGLHRDRRRACHNRLVDARRWWVFGCQDIHLLSPSWTDMNAVAPTGRPCWAPSGDRGSDTAPTRVGPGGGSVKVRVSRDPPKEPP